MVRFRTSSSVRQIVAGDGRAGGRSYRLNKPYGVFVDNNYAVYISDSNNHRIQKWIYGASYGSTIADTGTAGSGLIQLSRPSSIVMDQNEYMYITDTGNDRILRWALGASSGVCITALLISLIIEY